MRATEENEIKKEFQLERLIFFSDAVFAIIITIMILDVKLPEVERYSSESEALNTFLHLMPKLTGYAVSFYSVGRLWIKHLRIFSFLKDYNLQLISINLIFLFSVSLYPFALSFLFNSAHIMQYKWGIYTYIVITYLSGFTQTMLLGYLIKNKEELCVKTNEMEIVLRWKVKRFEYFVLPVIIILMACTIYFKFDLRTSLYVVLGPIFVFNVTKNIIMKIYYRHYKDDKVTFLSLFRKNETIYPAGKSIKHPVKKVAK
ncbi:MAG: potassium channel family protein [Mucilaginibacter sp.]|nr:potassium channel family protein [Mucilaginibacter sp.]